LSTRSKQGISFQFLEENAIHKMALTKSGNEIPANQAVYIPALLYFSQSQLVDCYPHKLIVIGGAPPAVLGQLTERGERDTDSIRRLSEKYVR
jgi:hypothetical protein